MRAIHIHEFTNQGMVKINVLICVSYLKSQGMRLQLGGGG